MVLTRLVQPCVLLKPRTGIRTGSRRLYVTCPSPRTVVRVGGYVGFTQRGLPTWKPMNGIGLRRLYVTCPPDPGDKWQLLGYVGFT